MTILVDAGARALLPEINVLEYPDILAAQDRPFLLTGVTWMSEARRQAVLHALPEDAKILNHPGRVASRRQVWEVCGYQEIASLHESDFPFVLRYDDPMGMIDSPAVYSREELQALLPKLIMAGYDSAQLTAVMPSEEEVRCATKTPEGWRGDQTAELDEMLEKLGIDVATVQYTKQKDRRIEIRHIDDSWRALDP